ncbi:alpha/beta hydrolase [Bacillus daqingensis]|uniref:Alpha/beta hydrolase n=1 Tax=Bacillus daqingensis TaxID=872396 RepID=A0ABV9NXW4_9BACI
MSHTHEELVRRLEGNIAHSTEDNISILHKEIPFEEGRRGLDPRVKHYLKTEAGLRNRRPMDMEDLEAARRRVELHNWDLSTGVEKTMATIHAENRSLPLSVFRHGKGKKPVVLYLHGGGFFERDVEAMENVCKLLAEKADAVVAAVHYRLAPEHPYQEGLNDCLEAARYLYDHAEEWNMDRSKFGLIGDSVGGNLALGLHQLSGREPWEITYIGMFCPLVDLSELSRNTWRINDYNMIEDADLIYRELVTMKDSLMFVQSLYLENLEDVYRPLVSPLLRKDKSTFPPMTIITAEYDYLRVQAEAFSKQLAEAQVPVRHFRYKGMDHAFVRKLGYYPQAADAINEISKHFQHEVNKSARL